MSATLIEFGKFRLDFTEHLLYGEDGEVVPLKPKVVETLELLVQESGRLISKDELMSRLWPDTVVEESNLTQNVYLLRKVLGSDPNGRSYIENVPKRGYRFTAVAMKQLDLSLVRVAHRPERRIPQVTRSRSYRSRMKVGPAG